MTLYHAEVNEVRMRGDDAYRQSHVANEQSSGKVGEVEMATQYANTELKRLHVLGTPKRVNPKRVNPNLGFTLFGFTPLPSKNIS